MMNERGIVLPVTLAFVLAFSVMGFSTIYLATLQNEAAQKRIDSEKAFWLAEAGIQRAFWEEKFNGCQNIPLAASGKKELSSADAGLDEKFEKQEARYDIKMDSACSTATSTGSFHSTRTLQLTKASKFDHALYAKDQIILKNGTTIDSYNSDLGSYESTKSSNGDVGSNSTISDLADSAIYLQGFGANPKNIIKGDVSTGPGGIIYGFKLDDKDIDNAVTGEITHANNRKLEDVEVPSSLKMLSQKEKLDIHDTFTISTGDYKYSSINVINKGNLIIDGNVRIYLTNINPKTNSEINSSALKVWNSSKITINLNSSLTLYTDGDVSVTSGSNINNLTKDPKKLSIHSTVSTEGTEGIDIWGESEFYGTIDAPGAHVYIDNKSGIFGAFIAKDFLIPINVKLHYDEALAGKFTDGDAIWCELANGEDQCSLQ